MVRRIYEAQLEIWQDFEDYETCHSRERASVSGLYTGTYEPESIFRALTRHALYSEKIYLLDPFFYPSQIREEFNPLYHPEEHRANAIKFTFFWLTLVPWIESGIVNFVRSPADFIPGLQHEILKLQRSRFENSKELQRTLKEQTKEMLSEMSALDRGITEHHLLSHPDEWHVKRYQQFPGEMPFPTIDDLLQFIRARRDSHPYYVDRLPGQKAEILQQTSGANYELAKRICAITNSHLITDLKSRWKEIELDREEAGIDLAGWTPFAKALQNADLQILNHVSLNAALQLRKEKRLENMRLFFRKLWNSCRDPAEFSGANAVNLSAELDERIQEAKSEWKEIDRNLLKWFGTSVSAAIVSTGSVGFVPAAAATAVAGIAGLIQTQSKRAVFQERYPAGFFLTVKNQ